MWDMVGLVYTLASKFSTNILQTFAIRKFTLQYKVNTGLTIDNIASHSHSYTQVYHFTVPGQKGSSDALFCTKSAHLHHRLSLRNVYNNQRKFVLASANL